MMTTKLTLVAPPAPTFRTTLHVQCRPMARGG